MPVNDETPKPFFTRRELCRSVKAIASKIDNECPPELYAALDRTLAGCERVRSFLGFPMTIHSGYRCHLLNQMVGGAKDSQHMKAEAVDFTCPAYGTPADVAFALAPEMESLGIDQMILEPGWVHVSFTLNPRFEVLRAVGGKYMAGLA